MADRVQEARKLSIHFGCIASSDGVKKSGQHRDELETPEKVVAFEIKDTSVWDWFFTIVIKSVCNYVNSYKKQRVVGICGHYCSGLYKGTYRGMEECEQALEAVDLNWYRNKPPRK
ncbi:hypothetical protein TWF225_008450 [Orbilia oligospora]|nr:hypothetical protein TWF751_001770 [Orbilia oligospora]KAF3177043.1 hypothetical protein TWF225_008450 [Orbilia oligospora]KAF3240159.1 hypothetical protein TWF217_001084 [Orbilia oligospora]KAF3249176.1 hypothetical protein TWF128_007858 [Orbilia oligospora]KAF3279580.1 hypothetical protein TWF132_000569 [Orbilia oligospora]